MKKITLFLMASFLGFFGFSQVKAPTMFLEAEPPMRLTQESDVHFYRGDEVRHLRAYGDTLYSFNMNDSIPTGWFCVDNTGNGYTFYWDTVGPDGAYTHKTGEAWNSPLAALASTTGSNGFLKFPADAYNTDSSTGKIKSDYVTHDSYIQTPAFDFSGKTNVILRFQERFRVCCSYTDADLYVEVSNDSTNWTPYKVASPYALVNKQSADDSLATFVEVNISKEAAMQSKVWVRWHINGLSHYYWMFDDVAFVEGPKNDVAFTNYVPQFYMELNGNGYVDDWYRLRPVKQTTPVVSWKSTVANNGSNTASGVKLNVEVTDENGTPVHSFSYDTLYLNGAADTIAPFEADTIEPTTANAFYMDTTAMHQYTVKSYVSMDSADQEASNDEAQEMYVDLTDTVMARAIVNTYYVGVGGWVNTASGDAIGVELYLPNKDTIGSLTFYISSSTDTEDVSFDITLFVYDGTAWQSDVITSADPIPVTGDMLGHWVTVPFDYNTFDRTIEGGTLVFVGVKQYYDLANQTFRIGANTDYKSEGGTFYSGGTMYGMSSIPTVQLNFHRTPVGINQVEIHDTPIRVYPNPAQNMLHINGVVEGSTIEIYNMLGAEVASIAHANVSNTMSVAELPAGNYIVKIVNDNQVVTRKIAIVK